MAMTNSSTGSNVQLASDIWEFAGALYAYPGVADACLQLQDQWGLNVNILLWCYWLETRACRLDSVGLQAALASIKVLDQDYIQPLRAMRRQLKQHGAENLLEEMRQHIKQAELLGEHHLLTELALLSGLWPRTTPDKVVSGNNALLYLRHLGLAPTVLDSSCALLGRALTQLQLKKST
jgi:uncharacterized protein (TIGR02444 family)